MTPACAFSMNQSSVQAIHSEGKGRIPVSVACFNYSIAEVWTANTCLTTACLANNGTCRRCEKHAADYYCSFKMLPTVRITRGGLRLQSNNPIIISSSSTGKKTCVRRTRLWEFLGVRTMIYASRDAGFCVPESPVVYILSINTRKWKS